jgi:dTDP-4-amino-4,6-dideoxygalactose transaminase
MGRKFGGKEGDCPVTEYVSDRLLRLPFYNDLTVADQDRIVTAVREFRWQGNSAPKMAGLGARATTGDEVS